MNSLKKIIKHSSHTIRALVSAGLLLAFLLFVPPSDEHFAVSFVPLILGWLVLFFTLIAILNTVSQNGSRHMRVVISAVGASIVVLMVMFSALGELALFDTLLLISLAVVGVFYFSRTWPK